MLASQHQSIPRKSTRERYTQITENYKHNLNVHKLFRRPSERKSTDSTRRFGSLSVQTNRKRRQSCRMPEEIRKNWSNWLQQMKNTRVRACAWQICIENAVCENERENYISSTGESFLPGLECYLLLFHRKCFSSLQWIYWLRWASNMVSHCAVLGPWVRRWSKWNRQDK